MPGKYIKLKSGDWGIIVPLSEITLDKPMEIVRSRGDKSREWVGQMFTTIIRGGVQYGICTIRKRD